VKNGVFTFSVLSNTEWIVYIFIGPQNIISSLHFRLRCGARSGCRWWHGNASAAVATASRIRGRRLGGFAIIGHLLLYLAHLLADFFENVCSTNEDEDREVHGFKEKNECDQESTLALIVAWECPCGRMD
jgi:hypothetical protein